MAGRAITAPMALCLLAAAASAQSSSSECTSALVSLSPCLDYISGNETTAPSSCCSQLETVVRSEPQCLCAALGGGSSSLGGVSINRTRALGLAGACKVRTPPVSECNRTSGGSKATPTTPYLASGGPSLRGPVGLVVGLAVVALYTVSAV